jgi:hypothetical protein
MATITSLAAGGVVALLALAAHERGAAEPILPLKLRLDRVIAVCSLSGFTGDMVMMSINAFLPLYVQGAMGRSSAAAGLALGAASVSWTFASVAAGRLMIRAGIVTETGSEASGVSDRMSAWARSATAAIASRPRLSSTRSGSISASP